MFCWAALKTRSPPVGQSVTRGGRAWGLCSAGPPQRKCPPRGAERHTKWAGVGAIYLAYTRSRKNSDSCGTYVTTIRQAKMTSTNGIR